MESKFQSKHGMNFRVASNTGVCGSLVLGAADVKSKWLDRLIPSIGVKCLPANPISKVMC